MLVDSQLQVIHAHYCEGMADAESTQHRKCPFTGQPIGRSSRRVRLPQHVSIDRFDLSSPNEVVRSGHPILAANHHFELDLGVVW